MKDKILVVDDEMRIRDLLGKFLMKKGYEVRIASNVSEAIRIVKEDKPKIVLLDIRMPDMSGIEAIKKIREFDLDVGIIMATAVIDEETAQEAVRLGASDYIIKPFDLDYLEKVLSVKLALLQEE